MDSDSIPTIESSYILKSSIPLMRNMLTNDDASSDPGVMRNNSNNDIQEDWGLVSADEASNGVLILASSGEIESLEARGKAAGIPSTLSVPGIDSIPSDIGSIRDEEPANYQNLLDAESVSRAGTDQLLISVEEIREFKNKTKQGYTAIGLLTLFFMVTTSYLAYERHVWKISNNDLEVQLREVEEQLNKTKAVKSLIYPASWMLSGGDSSNACEPPQLEKVISRKLGKCAARARETVQTKAQEIGKIAFKAQEDFVSKAQTSVTRAQEVIAEKAQEVLEKVDEGATQIRNVLAKEHSKIPKEWKKIATTVASGVVTVSLAALFADDVGEWVNGFGHNDNDSSRKK